MSKKTTKKATHDECVRTLAEDLKKEKWNVKANVEGYEKPPKIGENTPDLEAKKGCLRRICQVISEDELKADKEQYKEFKYYCEEYDFQLYTADKNGKLSLFDPKTLKKK
jgi:hypothetical protein